MNSIHFLYFFCISLIFSGQEPQLVGLILPRLARHTRKLTIPCLGQKPRPRISMHDCLVRRPVHLPPLDSSATCHLESETVQTFVEDFFWTYVNRRGSAVAVRCHYTAMQSCLRRGKTLENRRKYVSRRNIWISHLFYRNSAVIK